MRKLMKLGSLALCFTFAAVVLAACGTSTTVKAKHLDATQFTSHTDWSTGVTSATATNSGDKVKVTVAADSVGLELDLAGLFKDVFKVKKSTDKVKEGFYFERSDIANKVEGTEDKYYVYSYASTTNQSPDDDATPYYKNAETETVLRSTIDGGQIFRQAESLDQFVTYVYPDRTMPATTTFGDKITGETTSLEYEFVFYGYSKEYKLTLQVVLAS